MTILNDTVRGSVVASVSIDGQSPTTVNSTAGGSPNALPGLYNNFFSTTLDTASNVHTARLQIMQVTGLQKFSFRFFTYTSAFDTIDAMPYLRTASSRRVESPSFLGLATNSELSTASFKEISPSAKDANVRGIIAGSISAAIGVVLIIIASLLWWRRRRHIYMQDLQYTKPSPFISSESHMPTLADSVAFPLPAPNYPPLHMFPQLQEILPPSPGSIGTLTSPLSGGGNKT
jgi:hypothetical protein